MIDWHSHILPCVDDGSRSLEESIALVDALRTQGVDLIVATPHYYANDESVDEFLARRDDSFRCLKGALCENSPEVVLGAEVRYYPGISRMAELKRLRIEGTKQLLLEMPTSKWTEYTVREIIELSGISGINLVLAHIERYFPLQSASVRDRLYESGIQMQVNASCFRDVFLKRRVLRLLDEGYIHFVGSDCHNMSSRPPRMNAAVEAISKRFGNDFLSQMTEYGYSVLGR